MNVFEFIQKFFLFLLPGILGSYLYAALNVQKEQHYYFEFLKIIMLSFISYLATDACFGAIKKLFPCFIFNPIDIIHHIGAVESGIATANVLASVILALFWACILTRAQYENWLFKLANKLKLTRRIDNQTVWEHVFDDSDVVVLRDRITKNTYYGKVISYSDNSENREIYFGDVYVFDEYSDLLYHADKLYLSRAHNEFTVEIQNDSQSTEGENKNESKKN